MKKRTILGISMAVLLPLVSYFIVNSLSKSAVIMPKRYFYDSVVNVTNDGKTTVDTVWHSVKPVQLVNQFGKQVTLNDPELKDKILIVDFFFTSCPSICPSLTRNMKKMQDAFNKTDTVLRFISITVDPARDSAEKLKSYGDKYNINHDTWWMLTGDKQVIYDLAMKEFKANIADTDVDTNFIHTDKFFLLDKGRVVRGWYSGLDSAHLDRLMNDVVLLQLERDKKKKRNLFRK
ncbi:MAG TPA: SCO family protein [Chitinophagaceae bacterium]|nr:SCO family protein [Chitinophagaceae bacterium]